MPEDNINVGSKSGEWEIVGEPYEKTKGNKCVDCKCGQCKETVVAKPLHAVKSGLTGVCKRCANENKRKVNIGEVYGIWTIVDKVTYNQDRVSWKCQCPNGHTRLFQPIQLQKVPGHPCFQCGKSPLSTRLENMAWHQVLEAARCRGFTVTIDKEYVIQLLEKQQYRCALSGVTIALASSVENYWVEKTASLDRIDSTLGYCEGNVQWVHKTVNRAKVNSSDEDFIAMCRSVANHNPIPSVTADIWYACDCRI
jgi:hypothetical protein